MTDSLQATYEAIGDSVAARRLHLDVVTVSGPDARSYLQGQCSQDLSALQPGECVESLILSPQGKLDAYVRVYCKAADELDVIVAEGFGEALRERLSRFKLRVKADLALRRVPVVELRGPKADGYRGTAAEVLALDWPGYRGLDLLGVEALPDGLVEGSPEAFEAARIEAGLPVMGNELDESTIPPEAGIVGRTVSFTKGCFTGQELVARLDARGNRVARHLRGLVLGADAEVGSALFLGDKQVGALTSVAYSPGRGAPVALGYLRREVEPPATVLLGGADGTASAEVLALPENS